MNDTYQSIDETMKKKYDSKTYYVYDTNINSGKEDSIQDETLGERDVKKLTKTRCRR